MFTLKSLSNYQLLLVGRPRSYRMNTWLSLKVQLQHLSLLSSQLRLTVWKLRRRCVDQLVCLSICSVCEKNKMTLDQNVFCHHALLESE